MASGSGWNLSRRWVWVKSMGVANGCGCKEVYRFPHITYSYILLLYLLIFAAVSQLFVHFLCFSFFINKFTFPSIQYCNNSDFYNFSYTKSL